LLKTDDKEEKFKTPREQRYFTNKGIKRRMADYKRPQ